MQTLESLNFPDTSELVSIIMPVHNGEKFIREAVESVFSQSYTNWHLIIVNDMSTDKTRYILEEFTSSSFKNRIEIIENKENLGVALSRNRAISQASGDWIAFLDADDVWHPNKLREQLHLARLNSSLVVFSPYYVMNEEGVVNGIVQNKPIVELKDMLHFNPIGNLTGMYKSSILGKFLQKK
ncbi:glycosyltransferase family 2 protein [Meiothermus ruber]|uniref:glycosyltransferase family 2 protein n=1 Tax=Meiothermus ruber TaxID=277 RepID=UPI0007236396|nr:glycosyltransferase family 2 protein [Meiothermus ruber]GAO75682.1 TuaG-like glycosyl transferase [Meiothermus ruber H328]